METNSGSELKRKMVPLPSHLHRLIKMEAVATEKDMAVIIQEGWDLYAKANPQSWRADKGSGRGR
jgi:hypothetical protein